MKILLDIDFQDKTLDEIDKSCIALELSRTQVIKLMLDRFVNIAEMTEKGIVVLSNPENKKYVFSVEQIQVAFDNFGEKLKMEKKDIADAWHGFMTQLMAVYGVDVNYKKDGD
jgi:hypothetical protein